MTSNHTSIVKELASRLIADGSVVTTTGGDKRLFMVTSTHLNMDEHGIMISLEGGGCHFWTGGRPINAFQLISSGFDMETSATLADVLNLITEEMAITAAKP